MGTGKETVAEGYSSIWGQGGSRHGKLRGCPSPGLAELELGGWGISLGEEPVTCEGSPCVVCSSSQTLYPGPRKCVLMPQVVFSAQF